MTRLLLLMGTALLTTAMAPAKVAGHEASQAPADCFSQYWVCSVTTDWSGTRPDCYEQYVACMMASGND